MINSIDSQYHLSFIKIDPSMHELLPLTIKVRKGNYSAKAILAFWATTLIQRARLENLSTFIFEVYCKILWIFLCVLFQEFFLESV